MPALIPAEVTMLPWSTQRTPVSTVSCGNCLRKSSTSSQCVVTLSWVMTPLAANRNAPVHTEAVMPARADSLAIHSRVEPSCIAASTTPPGTNKTSAPRPSESAKVLSGITRSPARAETGAAVRATHRTAHHAWACGCSRWCMRAAVVNTSNGPAKSRASMPSKVRMVMRRLVMPGPLSWHWPAHRPRSKPVQSGLAARWRCAS